MRFWKPILTLFLSISTSLFSGYLFALPTYCSNNSSTLTQDAVADALGWVESNAFPCGGYYREEAISYPKNMINTDKLLITSNEGSFSFHGTSISQGKVTITRAGQQISANKALLYRDPITGKLSTIDLSGSVKLREPNQLILGQCAHLDVRNNFKSISNILYRTTIYSDASTRPPPVSYQAQQAERKITQLSAWGQANSFSQQITKVYDMSGATYSTCPPTNRAWLVKAESLKLNKNTGRGEAKNARLYVKNIPVFYTPYFNFPIDTRRQTGFLFPRIGSSNRFGPYIMAPFYWNLAPNYDTTITPAFLSKRGLQMSDLYRYLTPIRTGQFTASILPNDKEYQIFKETSTNTYQNSTSPNVESNLRTLQNSSNTRKSFSWVDNARYNDNWTSSIDYSYVGDGYYMRDLSGNINEVANNQLLQQAQAAYTGANWNFTSRIQTYQTLNQVDQPLVSTVYGRFPQLTLDGSYPDEKFGLEYFIANDLTRFGIRSAPGNSTKLPMGVRTNIQPGISKPINLPYFYVTPRLQLAFTQYNIGDVANTQPTSPSRTLPIFDVNSGFYFDRETGWFGKAYKQTLEPQIYYTYIPYKNQNNLPVFDTILNTLTYDQLFTYNRFSGIDRIGDANQISLGVTTRFIDHASGYEKITAGLGEIVYFRKRSVTLCSPTGNCETVYNNPNSPNNINNTSNRSPLSGVLKYNVNPSWNVVANTIWNGTTSRVDNQNVALQYKPEARKIINIGYNFVRNGDVLLPWESTNSPTSNLSQTDLSFSWPVSYAWSALGRWTEDWNQKRLQNMLYGLQYDSCCWAARVVGGRAFVAISPNNTFQYNNQFYVEFSLKGLGNYGPGGDPSTLLANSIAGYQSNFGRNY